MSLLNSFFKKSQGNVKLLKVNQFLLNTRSFITPLSKQTLKTDDDLLSNNINFVSNNNINDTKKQKELPDLSLSDFLNMNKDIDISKLRDDLLNNNKTLDDVQNIKITNIKPQNNKKLPHVEYSGLKIEPLNYELYSKNRINEILKSKLNISDYNNIDYIPYLAASTVLPMRTNNYVVDQLIDWNNIPNDNIFQLTFPQPGMLNENDLNNIINILLDESKGKENIGNNKKSTKLSKFIKLREEAEKIRSGLNPHPAGQKQLNVPKIELNGKIHDIPGLQHKYRETVLFFPNESQFCHAFCTYCFRWAQFTSVGSEQAFSANDSELLHEYLRKNKDVTDLLFTGGDPMVMTAKQFAKYIDPILIDPELSHINTIRIGTKSLAYWPYRFVTDDDSYDILRLFERVVASGKQLNISAHISHWKELSTDVSQEAIRKIKLTGANIRTQSPIIKHVNDDSNIWAEKWRLETRLGCIPYYMFIERDTGARKYFELPLIQAYNIFQNAISKQSGLSRTVRGPSMSCTPGKVQVMGLIDIPSQYNNNKLDKAILLQFLQGRNPNWTNKPFLAKYDPNVTWFDQLKPYYDNSKFFFENELEDITNTPQSSGQLYPNQKSLTDHIIIPGMTKNMHYDIIQLKNQRKTFQKRKNWNQQIR